MKKLLMISLALVLAAPAFADDAQPPKIDTAPRTTVIPPAEYTMNDCVTILGGLQALDGYQTITNQGKPNEGTLTIAYKFGNATLRSDIGQNLARLRDIPIEVEKARKQIVSEITGGVDIVSPGVNATQAEKDEYSKKNTAYSKQLVALGESPCRVTLIHIKAADLKLDVNEIPGTALSSIDKILDK
jgi:hypothetical protein